MSLIFDISKSGRVGAVPPAPLSKRDISTLIPKGMERKSECSLPEVAEIDLVRHYTNLCRINFGVDNGFYPLGSCTMKYNPKINEEVAKLPKFANSHPLTPELSQGSLKALYLAQEHLATVTGMKAVSLQPAAGAHGELTGVMLIKAYHEDRGDFNRCEMIVPDSAHGTNPATASMAGLTSVEIKSKDDGSVDIEALKAALNEKTAGLMLTNPSTLGLFDTDIIEIAKVVHDAGGLLYYDGANFNGIMGVARPGDMGFDVVHLNLHKSFSTPHGGGGPGSGPVGVNEKLEPYLPAPTVKFDGETYSNDYSREKSIGMVRSFYGNFSVVLKALTYILSLGRDGLTEVGEIAVLNANYLQHLLKDVYNIPYYGLCKHEFVLSVDNINSVSATDIAKSLIDANFHPPTMYFPLIVKEALMIEPTETESKETLENFANTLIALANQAKDDIAPLKNSPITTPIGRPDDVKAARSPIVKA